MENNKLTEAQYEATPFSVQSERVKRRNAKREQRRMELIAMLSEQDNNRSLKKIIWDKVFMLAGIVASFIMVTWFMATTILPLSVFGLIGRQDRVVYSLFADTIETTIEHTSANRSAWSSLTVGIGGGTFNGTDIKSGVYDFFFTRDPECIRVVGTIGATILVLCVISLFIFVVLLYSRDLLLISKTMIYVTRENNRENLSQIRQAVRDAKNLYRDEDERDTYVEVKIPGKKGRPKGSTKKQTEPASAPDVIYVDPSEEVAKKMKDASETPKKVKQSTTKEKDVKAEPTTKQVQQEVNTSKTETVTNTPRKLTFDDLTDEELNQVISNSKTLDDIALERSKLK